jgi:Uncharacterized protein conserved in bacteria (DUF2147)
MKRFLYLVILMTFGSSAHAGNSLSFVVGGHRITIEAPRDCASTACVSVSIPGIYQSRGGRDRYDDDNNDAASDSAEPAKPPAVAQQQGASLAVVQPPNKPAVQPVAAVLPPPATAAPVVAAPAQSKIEPASTPQAKPSQPTQTAPSAPAPRLVQVLQEVDDDPPETPIGDWQTEGNKGSVRIERCGSALCGYVLNASSNASGETVLINMKPKTASQWSGDIYSRDSGSTYYATMAMQGSDSLRVEACALGHFFCSGNVWSRIGAGPDRRVTSRRASWVPRS